MPANMESPSFLMKMPNEVLLRCVELILEDDDDDVAARKALVALCTANKRLCSMAQKFLYAQMTFNVLDEIPTSRIMPRGARRKADLARLETNLSCFERRAMRLNWAFYFNPALAGLLKELTIDFRRGKRRPPFVNAVSLVKQFPNIRSLELRDVYNMGSWRIAQGGIQITSLAESWEIANEEPLLTTVSIFCSFRTRDPLHLLACSWRLNLSQSKLTQRDSKQEHGTASFTELHIRSFECGNPDTLRRFLAWPARLKKFTLDKLDPVVPIWNPVTNQRANLGICSYQSLSSVLQHSKKTLKHLGVGHMGQQEGIDKFDIHEFDVLETLAIVFSAVIPRPADACRLWLTPTLQVLTIELYEGDQDLDWKLRRTQNVRDWIIEFAVLAAAYKNGTQDGEGEGYRRVALRKVELVLPTEEWDLQNGPGERLLQLKALEAANQALLDAGFEIRVPNLNVAV